MDIDKVIEELNGLNEIFNSMKNFGKSDFNYYIEELIKNYNGFIDRFCPLGIGDRVELTYTPNITKENAWGWLGYKHFLVKGSPGTVVSRSAREGKFSFGIEFDLDCYIADFSPNKPKEVKSSRRMHAFSFGENNLIKTDKSKMLFDNLREESKVPGWVFIVAQDGGWLELLNKYLIPNNNGCLL